MEIDVMPRRVEANAGHPVVVNMSIRSGDAALIALARDTGRFVYVGRAVRRMGLAASIWANPYRLPVDATPAERLAVVYAYAEMLAQRPDLRALLPGLRGKVLGCWCHPLPCHAHRIAAAVAAACSLPELHRRQEDRSRVHASMIGP